MVKDRHGNSFVKGFLSTRPGLVSESHGSRRKYEFPKIDPNEDYDNWVISQEKEDAWMNWFKTNLTAVLSSKRNMGILMAEAKKRNVLRCTDKELNNFRKWGIENKVLRILQPVEFDSIFPSKFSRREKDINDYLVGIYSDAYFTFKKIIVNNTKRPNFLFHGFDGNKHIIGEITCKKLDTTQLLQNSLDRLTYFLIDLGIPKNETRMLVFSAFTGVEKSVSLQRDFARNNNLLLISWNPFAGTYKEM